MEFHPRANGAVTASPALELRGISKRFGETQALDDVSCVVRTGTVHALLGENGAGKTTLMRIAFGLVAPDQGRVLLEGKPLALGSSRAAIAAGIGMVHQHFTLVPSMTVAENVALGGSGRFDARAAAREVERIGAETGLKLDPWARAGALPVGAQQRLEIVKALAHQARVLILDEPTAVLAPSEAAELAQWLRGFTAVGGTVVLITHKLREALALADDVTVLRRGRQVLAVAAAETDEGAVIRALIGEEGDAVLAPSVEVRAKSLGEVVLALEGASVTDDSGVVRLKPTTLTVRRGEVLGVAGVEGSGQRELLRLLARRLTPTTGVVHAPARVGFIPEDRLADAMIPALTLVENVALAESGWARGTMDWSAWRERTTSIVEAQDVRAGGVNSAGSSLSGGNQQKLIVGREREVAADALVAENPTRGLDIQAAARVRAAITGTGRGASPTRTSSAGSSPAVVYYSADLDEVLAVADRLVVCFAGELREIADLNDSSAIARAMVGAP